MEKRGLVQVLKILYQINVCRPKGLSGTTLNTLLFKVSRNPVWMDKVALD